MELRPDVQFAGFLGCQLFRGRRARPRKGVIPIDRWHDPYMPMAELNAEVDRGVRYYGFYMREANDHRLASDRRIQAVVALAG